MLKPKCEPFKNLNTKGVCEPQRIWNPLSSCEPSINWKPILECESTKPEPCEVILRANSYIKNTVRLRAIW